MGKLIQYILILAIIDLLFIITGQLGFESSTSVILSALVNPSIVLTSNWWASLIKGTGAISSLIITTVVIAGIATRNSDITIFAAMAGVLALLAADFILIYNHLASLNLVLATMIMSPVIIVYVMTVVAWLRGKD